ncbi:hypothetical protein ACFFUS_11640 [Vibrio gallaecicus]|uniref:hypothetical protein n=1 Tax=Vibrio gallaecicus TaxID=552386 RepID=UPI0010C9D3FA|nr:hypothetical protein [Vibrio gallaecicus]MDN3617387.1 hypothetical protein [Vibrio gallaecicus]
MIYFMGFLMGYFSGTNFLVQQEIQTEGYGYSNPIFGFLSSIGSLGGALLLTLALYFIGVGEESGVLEGIYFMLAAFVGMFMSGYYEIRRFNYLFSALTIFINISLVFKVYLLTL